VGEDQRDPDFKLSVPHTRSHLPVLTPAQRAEARLGSHAVVLFSGGLDSTVALWWAMAHYRSVHAVTVDYGQPHQGELVASDQITRLANATPLRVNLGLPTSHRPRLGPFIRGHSALLTALAAIGIGVDGGDIILGTLATDPYPDTATSYLDTLAAGFSDLSDHAPTRVRTPLKSLKDKAAVAALGFELGAPLHLSWSCRQPLKSTPCWICPSCQSRSRLPEELTSRGLAPDTITAWQTVHGSPHHAAFDHATPDLTRLGVEFAAAGGLSEAPFGHRYTGPDGRERITSLMRTPRRRWQPANRSAAARHLRTVGLHPDGQPWEVIACGDGSIAATFPAPPAEVVTQCLLENLARPTQPPADQ
jgi:7-cyano-7-deazaguanine synthase